MVLCSFFVKVDHTHEPWLYPTMRKLLVILFCVTTGMTVANPALAHGGGGGGGGAGGGGGSGAAGGGNGGGGSHGGGEVTAHRQPSLTWA
jgi:uncharacterized membrane protein YgcG